MVISPFLFIGLSGGIGYLQGSSMAQSGKIAVISTVPAVTEGLKSTNGLNFDYQDEASVQAAIKDEKLKGYLTINQEDSVLKAVYHGETSLESGIKLGVTSKLNELQAQLNRSAANLSQEQEKRLEQTKNMQYLMPVYPDKRSPYGLNYAYAYPGPYTYHGSQYGMGPYAY